MAGVGRGVEPAVHHLWTNAWPPMPGLLELLEALERAGIPKAIGTSSSRELVAACLQPFGMEGRFQFILAAEDIVNGKPHPEIYLTAARRFGVPPGRDGGVRGQPERLPGGGGGGGLDRGRAGRAQPGARFQLGLAGGG